MSGLEAFWWGILGGFIGEFLLINRHRMAESAPKAWSKWYYWAIGLVWVALGGFAALLQVGGATLAPLIAVQLGATAPLALGQLARKLPDPSVGSVA